MLRVTGQGAPQPRRARIADWLARNRPSDAISTRGSRNHGLTVQLGAPGQAGPGHGAEGGPRHAAVTVRRPVARATVPDSGAILGPMSPSNLAGDPPCLPAAGTTPVATPIA